MQRAYTNTGEELSNKYPKSKTLQFIKRINYILHHIIKGASMSEFPIFYSDTNKSGKADFKSGKISGPKLL